MTTHLQAAGAADPRLIWSAVRDPAGPPALRHRRDGILPAVAAALSIRDEVLTCTGARGEQPPALHPIVQDFLDALPAGQRERFTGRCAEAVLISRHLIAVEGTARQAGRPQPAHPGRGPQGAARRPS